MLNLVESNILNLRKVQRSDLSAVKEYRAEFLANGDSMDGCSNLRRYESMEDWYQWIKNAESKETCPEHWVPDTQFLSIRPSDGRLIGMLDIRHELNEACLNLFGNIGYSIRASERGNGYAAEQLRLALIVCKHMGMDRVLISCHKENLPSAKTILRNGGVLENEVIDNRNGEVLQRYWITL